MFTVVFLFNYFLNIIGVVLRVGNVWANSKRTVAYTVVINVVFCGLYYTVVFTVVFLQTLLVLVFTVVFLFNYL